MNYPALIQFDGEDELEVIKNEHELSEFIDTVQIQCRLIDSDGATYAICQTADKNFSLSEKQQLLSTADVVFIAQKHLAALDHCCVSKFNAASVREVIQALTAVDP